MKSTLLEGSTLWLSIRAQTQNNITHLGIFVKGINKEFHITEELVSLVAVKGEKTGADLQRAVELVTQTREFSDIVCKSTYWGHYFVGQLREQFIIRFADLRPDNQAFPLIVTPFAVNMNSVAVHLQMRHARMIIGVFGSTYLCEQMFSKFAKNKIRSKLTSSSAGGIPPLTPTRPHPARRPTLVLLFALRSKRLPTSALQQLFEDINYIWCRVTIKTSEEDVAHCI